MSVNFVLATKTKVDSFKDRASINDVVKYEIDCTPWQEDNSPITSIAVTNDGASSAGISSQVLLNGVVSFFAMFTQSGTYNMRIVLTTATQKKTIWLKVQVIDRSKDGGGDDYGLGG